MKNLQILGLLPFFPPDLEDRDTENYTMEFFSGGGGRSCRSYWEERSLNLLIPAILYQESKFKLAQRIASPGCKSLFGQTKVSIINTHTHTRTKLMTYLRLCSLQSGCFKASHNDFTPSSPISLPFRSRCIRF